MGAEVNRVADGSAIIQIDQQSDSQQVVINIPDGVQMQSFVNDSSSTSPPPPSSHVSMLPSQAAGTSPTVVDQVPGETPTANVTVAVKSATSPRNAQALNSAAEV